MSTFSTADKLFFTSESVTEGHPDKLCDQVSDAVLDAIFAEDPMGRVACETATTKGMIFVLGEITTSAYVEIPRIARDTIREIGYRDSTHGFDADTCGVVVAINPQSHEISEGVSKALVIVTATTATPSTRPARRPVDDDSGSPANETEGVSAPDLAGAQDHP
jgi:S-adenosylmethionine synthetase